MLYPRSFFPIELGNIRKKKLDELEDLKCASKFKRVQDLPKLSKKASAQDSVKTVNKDFPDDGTTMNCMFCTTAMALRKKAMML